MLKELLARNKSCLLRKALYGLCQAGRSWHTKLDQSLRRIGVEPLSSDPCVYRMMKKDELTYIIIYVDDIISKNVKKYDEIQSKLALDFEVKDSGNIKYCLGIEFSQGDGKIFMNQRAYIKDC